MKLFNQSGTMDILFAIGGNEPSRLVPSRKADQKKPKRFYVYGHFEKEGTPFYIGKGTKRRAWDDDRHDLWHQYVEKHLNGEFSVVILEDDLSSEEAEDLENLWVAQESQTLVNWVNYGRETDFKAIEQFRQLRLKNRDLAEKAKALEKENLDEAISIYIRAIEAISAYANIQAEKGLVGQLIDEERAENGIQGDVAILDRLTLCLMKSRRYDDLVEATEAYFKKYRFDLQFKAAERCLIRMSKAKDKRSTPDATGQRC